MALARRRVTEALESLMACCRYFVAALKPLRLNAWKRADYLDHEFRPIADHVADLPTRSGNLNAFGSRAGESLVLVGLLLQLFVQPRFIDLDNAELIGLVQAMFFSLSPLQTLLRNLPRAIAVRQSLERMRATGIDLYRPNTVTAARSAEPDPASPSPAAIELRDVCFLYENESGEPAFGIGPLSLRAQASEVVFITGGNGDGRTTLAKVLCGLYAPTSGEIRLDGHPVGACCCSTPFSRTNPCCSSTNGRPTRIRTSANCFTKPSARPCARKGVFRSW